VTAILRGLRRHPSFTLPALVLVVLAVGANAALFTVADGVLVRPLAWPYAERLVAVWESGPGEFGDEVGVGLPDFFDWRASGVFERLAAYAPVGVDVSAAGEPEHLDALVVSADLLPLLGARAALGRGFSRDEELEGAPRVAMVSHAFWQSRLGGDPGALERTVLVGGEPHQVIGVLPASLQSPVPADVWLPLGHLRGNVRLWRASHPLTLLARLEPETTAEAAQQALARQAQAVWAAEAGSLDWEGWSVRLVPLGEQLLGDYTRTVALLWGAVALVLLVAVFNLANLLLARVAARRQELTLRAALGARGSTLGGHVAAEALAVTIAGTAGGLVVGHLALVALRAVLPPPLLHLVGPEIGPRAVAAGLVVGALLAVVALVIALAGQRLTGLATTLLTRAPAASRRPTRWLVVAQFALATPLLTAALLLLVSVRNLRNGDAGVTVERTLTFRTTLPAARYPTPALRRAFFDRLRADLASQGFAIAAFGSNVPLSAAGAAADTSVFVHGRPLDGERAAADVRVVSPDYFRALGMRLARGRWLGAADEDGPRTALVNETMARLAWPQGDPLGARILDGREPDFDSDDPARWFTVVGVVADARSGGLRAEPVPEVYLPAGHRPLRGATFVVRTSDDAERAAATIRRTVAAIDPGQPIFDVATLATLRDSSIHRERLALTLLASLAGLALAIAAVGLYGVVAHSVATRRRELGIRSALGAAAGRLLRQVLGRSALLALGGSAVGIALSAGLHPPLAALLYGVEPWDATVLAAATTAGLLVGALAALPAAVRAARVEPSAVLREG
jgi:putative ABC transport system permease protein